MLLIGLGLLPRLTLRLSLLYLPLRRGLLLTDRGVIERRGLEADREFPLPLDTSEYSERLRARPRGDSEAMVVLMLKECRGARSGTRGCRFIRQSRDLPVCFLLKVGGLALAALSKAINTSAAS